MILLIDNYDSFTYNLVDYFQQVGIECKIVKNDFDPKLYHNKGFDAIVISPGPGIPKKAGNILRAIDQFCRSKPILGICLGHQAICEFFGARLDHAIKPMHGKVSKIHCKEDIIFKDLPEYFNVVRYHSLICRDLPESLQVLAITDESEIMAIKHRELPIWGIQFHPEAALTEHGLKILKNWCEATLKTN